MISANPPSEHMKEQIKARFSIGQTTSLEDPLLSLPTKTTKPTLVRRKRKLTGGIKLVQEKPTIVLTSMTVSVRKQCQDIVQKLGHYELATEVTEHTTHVLVGAQRRTKLLTLGIARGAWILRPDWLIQSDSRGQYVSEKEYQVTDWYPGIEAAHQRVPLIPHATRIKVVSSTSEIEFIEQLVVLLGGTVVSKAQEADIVITNEPNGKKKHVLDNWLFECIEQWQYLPINDDTEKIKKLE
ncbi:uncharacterized protein B0P05DRAFT_527072 [Gilbertella persicaria]|nr:uncharacterized protein B0P05DRAFT_527072 [Gilbertella persicaria]KAI8091338.1 hypothetical protein B0P05DRAFT_527072 [Gilbertella persicaria]